MADISNYTINVPAEQLKLLSDKLAIATFPTPVDFSNDWNYGVPLGDIKRLAHYWANGFDWRAQEARLNKLPQFSTNVDVDGFGALSIHFVHQRSHRKNSIPLLFCHGWPGSFVEVMKILPLLTQNTDGQSFHVVAPSLPNYGFSDGVNKPGFGMPQYAEAMHKVMLSLGYTQYVTQGGDWGFAVTRMMGILYPQNVLASHLNMVRTKAPTLTSAPAGVANDKQSYTEEEKAGLERSRWFEKEGFGYNLLQSTKPSTIGMALTDSPVALLSWIYEKLHDWTDDYPWSDDEILTWVSIYQFSVAGPAASARIYYENIHASRGLTRKILEYNGATKLGISYFPRDIMVLPSAWGRTLGPVVFEVRHDRGGHFAAHETPELLVKDLRQMFGERGGAHDIIKTILAKGDSRL